MHARSSQRMPTFEELYEMIEQLPEGMTGEILDDDAISLMGRPGYRHRRANEAFLEWLFDEVKPDGRWVIEIEAEIRFGDRLAVPDLSGWRVGEDGTGFLRVNPILRVPDWTCEILSGSTARKDRFKKLPLYAEYGVSHSWLIDPDRRLVEVYAPRAALPDLVASAQAGETVRLPPFDLELDLATLWVPDEPE